MANDIAGLGIRVSTTGLDEAGAKLDKLTDSSKGAEDAAKTVGDAWTAAATKIAGNTGSILGELQSLNKTQSESLDVSRSIRDAFGALSTQLNTLSSSYSGASSASAAAAKSFEAVGAASEESTTRIRAMVQASLSASSSSAAIAESQRSIADRSVAAAAGLDKQTASSVDWNKEQEAMNTRAAALAASDLRRAAATKAATEATDAAKVSTSAASDAMHSFSLNSASARRELGILLKDAATGQWTRFEQSALTLANYSGVLGVVFSPLGVAIGAAAGALGVFAVAAASAYTEEQRLNQAVAQSGNFAGVTAGSFDQLASGIGTANGHLSEARDILNSLVQSGRVGSQSLQAVGQAALDIAELSGKSASDAAKDAIQGFDGTTTSLLKLNDQYHFLNDSTYDQVKALQDEGSEQEAVRVAAEAFHDAVEPRIQAMTDGVYGIAKAWVEVKGSFSDWLESFKAGASIIAGTASDQQNLFEMQGRREAASNHQYSAVGNLRNMFFGSGLVDQASSSFQQWSPDEEKQYQALLARVQQGQQSAADQATQTGLNDRGVSGASDLDRLSASLDKLTAKDQAIQRLNKDFNDLWAAASPDDKRLAGVQRLVGADGSVSFAGGLYDSLNADINKRYTQRTPRQKRDPEVSAYQTFSNQVDTLDTKSIAADTSALTQYEQGIAKLADQMDVYLSKGGDATKAADLFNRGQQSLEKTLDANRQKELDGENQYAAALQKTNAALSSRTDADVSRIGMGAKEYQQTQEVTKAYLDQADGLRQLALQRQAGLDGKQGGLSENAYNADVDALQKATDQRVSILQDGYRRMDQAQGDWLNGAKGALQDYVDSSKNVAGQTYTLFNNAFSNLGDSVANFALTGKLNFDSFAQGIISDLVKMETRILLSKALSSIFSSIGGGSVGGSDLVSVASAIGFSAKGNVFDNSDLSSFSNSIVSQPTFFTAYAKGGNVMGEAGPEAVMPLTRDESGRLGVRSSGGGGDTNVNVAVSIASDGSSSISSDQDAQGFGKQLGGQMAAIARKEIANAQRPGGSLWRQQVNR